MTHILKNLIVRDPVSGRIYMVEKVTKPQASVLTLRRLDREPREQSHIYRPKAELEGWEILETRGQVAAFMHLMDACRDLLGAREAHRNALPEVTVLLPGMDPHLDRIAELVRA